MAQLCFACSAVVPSGGAGGGGAGGDPSVTAATGDTVASVGASTTSSSAAAAVSASSAASTGSGGPGDPPFGGSSGGQGGPASANGSVEQAGGVAYYLIVPASYSPNKPTPFLLVYSGTEGGNQMAQNIITVGPIAGTSDFIAAVLDGVQYYGDGKAGRTVLDDVRSKYDVDNDRTYLLGESAGTSAAEELGFQLRESYFAAYWANDVNQAAVPGTDANTLGFKPWGQVGPGGQQGIAQQIVSGMQASHYRVPNPAPYNGPGAGSHGDPDQFIAAVSWFPGKSRK
jgi:hypothetical protein